MKDNEDKGAAKRIINRLRARGDHDLAGMLEQYFERRGTGGDDFGSLALLYFE
jgi:hypothetical protein